MKTHEDLENEYFDACQNARLEGEQFMDDAEMQSKQQKKTIIKREILFKAKRSDGKGWVEGDLLSKDRYRINSHSSANLVKVIPETVCQYTGLKDKNGEKIFEGDVILYHGTEFCVIWNGSLARYEVTPVGKSINHHKFLVIGTAKNSVIIRNIHNEK